ncbi:HlyD family secretion protein [Roseateles sp.]|uniref:HlyD family secretion protein n=1 Tax=Roseateles sp. TaxID=1971397 RepID=UPI002F3EBC69
MTDVPDGLPLFREEAMQSRNAPGGAILLARPVAFAMWTALAVLVVVGLLAFFLLCSTSATVRLSGVLTPESGLLRIVADRDARVADSRVAEGQVIRTGDALFVLRSGRGDAQDRGVEAEVARLLAQRRDSLVADARHRRAQDGQRLAAARIRRDALRDDQRRLDAEVTLQRRRVTLDVAALDRQLQLQSAGMGTVAATHDREIAVLDARQRLSQLEAALAASQRDQRTATQELRSAELQGQRDEEGHARALSALDQELAEHDARRETLIRAPVAGRVSALQTASGQAVVAGETLASLWPADTPLEAELKAPSRAAVFMSEGMAVRLQLDAFPHQTFGAVDGLVRSVDLVSSGPEATYRVRVRLRRPTMTARGVEHPLRPGMTLQAIVPLERRRLYEWVIDPLKRLSPTQSPLER